MARDIVCRPHWPVIDRASSSKPRGDLVIIFGEIPGEAVVPRLLELLRKARDLRGRLEAARALHRRGRSEGLAAMLREWQVETLPRQSGPFYDDDESTWTPTHGLLDSGYGVFGAGVGAELASFLASANDAAAAAALLDKLTHGSQVHRWAAMVAGFHAKAGSHPLDPSIVALREMSERLLIDELANEGKSGACVMLPDRLELRWCDIAAERLATFRPSHYAFDQFTPVEDRDRQIAIILRAWRAEHGLPAEPSAESQPASKPAR